MIFLFLDISEAIIALIMTKYKDLRADVESKPSLLSLCVSFQVLTVKDSKVQSTSSSVTMI